MSGVHERQADGDGMARPPLTIVQVIPTQAKADVGDYPFIEGQSVVLTLLATGETRIEAVLGPKLADVIAAQLGESTAKIGGVDVAGPGDVEQVARARAATDSIRQRRSRLERR